ncbi:hypothetical protein ENSA5_37220 [Enhygromyxa salina]|uniref:Peptidase M61 catalytic domain-containing protein n=2 Tax=Enhygromyxa salina TaxID=215803 RepID=A0A2S9XSL7_9BACT|nr:hypothetical protein ENSA5_37220 [Enhygromyxa salina]
MASVVACDHARVASDTPANRAPAEEQQGFAATLTREGDVWIVHYRFSEPQTALLFDTAHGDYRTSYWTPLDEGVQLENLDGLDGLFFEVPAQEVRLQIRRPSSRVAGTRPFLKFSDNSLAFYSGQLALLTVDSRVAAEALHGDLSLWHGQQPPVFVTFEANGPIVTDRRETPERVTVTAHLGAGPYIYDGPIPVIRTDASIMVVDPGLPEWLRVGVPKNLAAVDEALKGRWQTDIPDAVNLLAWEGPGEEWHNTGRAEGSQIAMSILGTRYLQPNQEVLADLIWFFAHERAHHFQLRPGVPIEEWPLEGAADMMATIVLADLSLIDQRGLQRRYARVQHQCAQELAQGPLDQLQGAHACGELLSLGTLNIIPNHDFFGFWRDLLAGAESQGARVDTSFYLYVLRKEGIDETILAAIQRFTSESHTDPDTATIELLQIFGLEPIYEREAGLQALDIVLPPEQP